MSAPPHIVTAQPTLPDDAWKTVSTTIHFVERNGWYILALTLFTIFCYYKIARAAQKVENNAPERVVTLQERMREQRIKQQSNWQQNSKVVVEQSKLERQIAQQQMAERRAANKEKGRDSDDESELIDLLGKAIAAKGGKINGKVVPTDRKSGFAASAFNSKATNSGNGKKFGGSGGSSQNFPARR